MTTQPTNEKQDYFISTIEQLSSQISEMNSTQQHCMNMYVTGHSIEEIARQLHLPTREIEEILGYCLESIK